MNLHQKAGLLLFGFALTSALMSPGQAQAQFGYRAPTLNDVRGAGRAIDPTNPNSAVRETGRAIDDWRNDQMQPNPRAGRDFTRIKFKNNSDREIRLAVDLDVFIPPTNGPVSTLSSSGSGGGGNNYETRAWYYLQPGETVYVGDTRNVNVYYYAEQKGGGVYGGNAIHKYVGKQRFGFRHMLVRAQYEPEYTMGLD